MQRLVFTVLALIAYRAFAHVPIPGIQPTLLAQLGGGDYADRLSAMSLGVWPYFGGLVIVELAKTLAPGLRRWELSHPRNERITSNFARGIALLTAIFQAIGIAYALEGVNGAVTEPGSAFRLTCVATLVGGAFFVMWLADRITERGIGSGVWIFLGAQILIDFPFTLSSLAGQGDAGLITHEIGLGLVFTLVIFAGAIALVGADGRSSAAATCLWAVVMAQALLPPMLATTMALFLPRAWLLEGPFTFAVLAFCVAAFAWLYARSLRYANLPAPAGMHLAVIAGGLAALIIANLALPEIVLKTMPRSSQLIMLALVVLSVLTPWWRPRNSNT
jgi:hypothetical protein